MRSSDASAMGCAVLIVAGVNIGLFVGAVALAAYVVKWVLFS